MDFLSGYKTYIVAAVGIVINVLIYQGVISADSIILVNTILAFLGLGTMRLAVAKK